MTGRVHQFPTRPTPFPIVTELDAVSTLSGPMVDVSTIEAADGGRVQLRRQGMDRFRVDARGGLDLVRLLAMATARVGHGPEARAAAAVAALLDQLDPAEEVTPPVPAS